LAVLWTGAITIICAALHQIRPLKMEMTKRPVIWSVRLSMWYMNAATSAAPIPPMAVWYRLS
jgi:hypothetical protein